MSTKKLSRTIIEGGRDNYGKFDRNRQHRSMRSKERQYLQKVKIDFEYCLENDIGEIRKSNERFTDKLAPLNRKLEQSIGRKWDDIWSELNKEFDFRTIKGWHLLYGHVLPLFFINSRFNKKYCIDENGVIQKNSIRENYYLQLEKDRIEKKSWFKENSKNLIKWLNKRKIRYIDGILYWFVCDADKNIILLINETEIIYINSVSLDSWQTKHFRKDIKLDKEEVNFFRSLPKFIKKRILNASQ